MSRKRLSLVLALLAALAGVSVSPELVVGLVEVVCEVAACG